MRRTFAQNASTPSTRAMDRRSFLAGGALGAGVLALSSCGSSGPAPYVTAATQNDVDILNFALNLEYLEATFYSYIVTGKDLNGNLTGGGPAPSGTPPKIATGNPQTDDLLAEILFDETSHVSALRNALGQEAVARPQLDLSALGTISATNVISIARLFEDIGTTAYAGAAGSLQASYNITAAAQILAAEAFHTGALRLVAIQSNAPAVPYTPPDGYDIPPADPGTVALAEQGPTQAKGGFFATEANGTPGENNSFNGFAFYRTPSQVLAIVYGNAAPGTKSGGLFPKGLAGNINTV